MNSLPEIWSELGRIGWKGHGWQTRAVAGGSRGKVELLAAVRHPEGLPALLMEMPSSAVPPGSQYPECDGFRVFPERLMAGPHGRMRLCIELADPRHRDIFALIAQDLVGVISAENEAEPAARAALDRLHAWKACMRYAASALGMEAQTGLVAELFLLETLSGRLPPFGVLEAWRGPLDALHDFEFPVVHLETKGTVSRGADAEFHCTSLAQLESQQGVTLLVSLVYLEVGPDGGPTLPELVSRISTRLAAEGKTAARSFEERLLHAGFLNAHSRWYEHLHWTVRRIATFEVRDGFPRIARSNLPEGVVGCSYSVRAAACMPFLIDLEKVVDLLGRNVR